MAPGTLTVSISRGISKAMMNGWRIKRIIFHYLMGIWFVAIMIGCTSHNSYTPQNTPSSSPSNDVHITDDPSNTPTQTYQVTKQPECNSRLSRIIDTPTYAFFWSDDSLLIYYASDPEQKDWRSININTMVTKKELDISSIVAIQSSALKHFPQLEKIEDFSVSPSGEKAIYYESSSESKQTPTSKIDGEAGVSPNSIFNRLYLLQQKIEDSAYLGQIEGAIKRVEWLPDDVHILVEMDPKSPTPLGPAYMWLVNVENLSVTSIFDVTKSRSTPYFAAISPDSLWILYTYQSDNNFSIRNIYDGADVQLSLPYSKWVWWVDNDHLMTIGHSDPSDIFKQSVYMYDFISRKTEQVTNFQFEVHPWMLNSLQLSPDRKTIAFLWKDSMELYIISLCSDY